MNVKWHLGTTNNVMVSRVDQNDSRSKQDTMCGNEIETAQHDDSRAGEQDNFSLGIDDYTCKAEIESQLNLKIVELQEMTAKASDAEKRVKSVEEKLAQALKEKRSEVSELSDKIKDMKGQHERTLKRKDAERNRLVKELECLQSQMESRRKSNPNTRSCLEGNYTNKSGKKKKPKGKTIKRKVRAELEALMNTNDIPNVSLDDIIGQKTAKDALLDLKPFRDPAYECLYADDEDNSNSNTGILLHGPPGTVS